ncbi:MAG: hypothetical protein GY828_03155 [Candidatus Gracilibacteria bacterium]|nr:hypothetical protein [Candidatus Gracilibacteria bacterium]
MATEKQINDLKKKVQKEELTYEGDLVLQIEGNYAIIDCIDNDNPTVIGGNKMIPVDYFL